MTISNTSIRKAGPSQGNGVNTSFPFTFKVFTTADVLVTYLNASSIETVLALGTDYNVSLNADQNAAPGGIVNLLWPPTSSTYITLTSQVTNTQTLTLTNSGGFYPQSINDALDRVVILIQQLAEQTSRCFRLPISSAASPAPSIPNSPNTVLGFNASGVLSALPATTGTSLITLGSPAGAALIGWTQVGLGGNVNRNVASKLIDTISANDFGAVGDGTTINNTFLQSFINTATGKIAYIPAGIYVVSNLSIVAGLTLIGAGQGLTILKRPPSDPTNNSILNITGATNVSISGITFDGNKTNQTLGSNSVTIGSSSNLSILDCELINSKAASGQGNGLAFINNSGQSSKQKITIRNCRFSNNDSTDLYINLSWYIEVTSCFMKGSGGGISVMNNVFPPVTDSQDYLLLSNNMIRDQAGNGIWVNGFIVSGTSVAPTLGSTNPASRGFAVSGNLISNCTGYGIAWQGASGSVVNNEIYQCGTIYGGGGVVFNAYASVFSGNTIRDCYNYGIDAGGVLGNSL